MAHQQPCVLQVKRAWQTGQVLVLSMGGISMNLFRFYERKLRVLLSADVLFFVFCFLITFAAPEQELSPGGEIGRRTVFRSQRSQGCDGSNPFLGTPKTL